MEQAAGQGHAYAMLWLGVTHDQWKEHAQAVARGIIKLSTRTRPMSHL